MKHAMLFAGLAAAGMAAAPAAAHHSYAPFDMTHPIEVTGTIKEFRWTNPHSWLFLTVPNDQGGTDLWTIEGPAVAMMARNGWTINTLHTGMKIHVILAPRRDGSHSGSFSRVDLEDGTILNTGRLRPTAAN